MKAFLLKLALFVALVGTIDLTLSHVLDFGRPLDYAAFVDSKKTFDQLDRVDILFIGDSHTADGFVPSLFQEKLGAVAFNFGVYQLSPFEQYFLLKDLIGRQKQPPRLVVLGTDVQMFHYYVTDGRYSPLFIENPLNEIPLWFASDNLGAMTSAGRKKFLFPALFKKLQHREVIADTRREANHIENGYLRNRKHFIDYSQFDCDKDRDFFSATFVDRQKEYFLKTLDFLSEQHIPFVIANPPMHPHFLAGMKRKPLFDEFNATMAEAEALYRVSIFNREHTMLLDELRDEDFLDGDHLCYPGARKFSEALAEHLQHQGFRFN